MIGQKHLGASLQRTKDECVHAVLLHRLRRRRRLIIWHRGRCCRVMRHFWFFFSSFPFALFRTAKFVVRACITNDPPNAQNSAQVLPRCLYCICFDFLDRNVLLKLFVPVCCKLRFFTGSSCILHISSVTNRELCPWLKCIVYIILTYSNICCP